MQKINRIVENVCLGRDGEDRCNGICIGIEDGAIGMGEWSEYRNYILLQQEIQQGRVDTRWVMSPTKPKSTSLYGTLHRLDHVSIGTGHTHGIAVHLLEARYNLFVDQPSVHHSDEVERGCV